MAKTVYKMVPVKPEVYADMEAKRESLGYPSFSEMLSVVFGSRPKSMLGSLKGEAWLRDIKRDKFDRY